MSNHYLCFTQVFHGVGAFTGADRDGELVMESVSSAEGEVVPLRRGVQLWPAGKK